MTSAPVIAVVGPSGVGKDSVMQALAAHDPGFVIARRVITRESDPGGEDHIPVSESAFARMQADGAFALNWQAHGLSYGIPTAIDDWRRDARAVLVNLSRSALIEAQARLDPFFVLSLTADPTLLAQRLQMRGREDADDRARRLGRAAVALPAGLDRVLEVDNSGPLEDTVAAILAGLQPESV